MVRVDVKGEAVLMIAFCLGSALALVGAGVAIIRGRTAWRVVGGIVTMLFAIPVGVYGVWLLNVLIAGE